MPVFEISVYRHENTGMPKLRLQYQTNLAAYFHFDENFGQNDEYTSKMTRSYVNFGLPLKGYDSVLDEPNNQVWAVNKEPQ